MLNCDEASRYLLYAADDPTLLDMAAITALKDHVAACSRCRQEFESQRAVAVLLRQRPPDVLSPGFSAALAARLDSAQGWLAMADWRRWTFRLLPATTMVFLAALFWPTQTRQAPSPPNVIDSAVVAPSSTPDAILWQFGAPADAVVEAMLTGRRPEGGTGR